MPAPAASVGYMPSAAAAPSSIVLRRGEFEGQLGDLERVANDVSLMPISGAGYRLMALRPGSYVEHLGLRAGDIVLTVDGRPILSPDDAARAFAWLRLTDRFTVDVLRDGGRVTLRYQIAG